MAQPDEKTVRMFDGQTIRVIATEVVGRELDRVGCIEPAVTSMLVDNLRPGMVFVDVGAQYGYYTLLASRLVRPGGTVVAFEPSRESFRLLRENVSRREGVFVEARALHDHCGTTRFTDFGPRHSALNTVLGSARVPKPERETLHWSAYSVPTVTLDAYVRQRRLHPDIVKLDAEGAEHAILRGMTETLARDRPVVILETGDYDGMASPPTSASIELLQTAGYDVFDYDDGLVPHRRRHTYGYGNLFFVPRRSV